MGAWINVMVESQSPRYCYSTEDYNEYTNDYTNVIEEKLIPEWFLLPYCDDCKEHTEFTNIVCPHQFTHKVSLSCVICGTVYIVYYYNYKYNPTCSHDCYVKYNTIPLLIVKTIS